jgi:hypothetical protein
MGMRSSGMGGQGMSARMSWVMAAAAAVGAMVAGAAWSGPAQAVRTGIIHRAPTSARLAMTQSNNWSGYNQGLLEKGTTFHEVSGTWVVPKATQHRSGEAEFSATWVGIGGGCVDSGCRVVDSTLIQAGTEQDVDSKGQASYSAWWEIIPAPSITVSLPVSAGQKVHVDVAEGLPEVWTITISNLSTGKSFSMTVPYSSSYATAEWIEETPLLIGTGGAGISAMPKLSTVVFDPGTANRTSPHLVSSEAIQLVDSSGKVLATPSKPDSDTDGFADCTYATSCSPNAS